MNAIRKYINDKIYFIISKLATKLNKITDKTYIDLLRNFLI